MLENKIEEYLKKKLIGNISVSYKYSKNIDKTYDVLYVEQETFTNILNYTICFDHRWQFEQIKEKMENHIVNSIMNRFINK